MSPPRGWPETAELRPTTAGSACNLQMLGGFYIALIAGVDALFARCSLSIMAQPQGFETLSVLIYTGAVQFRDVTGGFDR